MYMYILVCCRVKQLPGNLFDFITNAMQDTLPTKDYLASSPGFLCVEVWKPRDEARIIYSASAEDSTKSAKPELV